MKHSILIVEDNLEMQELLKLLLEPEGYHVITATTGSDALNILHNHPSLMLMLLDLTLPDMRAPILLDHMKKNRLARNVPIMFFSATSELQDLSLPEGVVGVIQKPFPIKGFLETIGSFRKKYQSVSNSFTMRLLSKQACPRDERLTS